MPFRSPQQETYMRIHHPDIYRRWVKAYGHYDGGALHAAVESEKKRSEKKRGKR